MQELDLETLRFRPRGRSVHFVKLHESVCPGDAGVVQTYCGRRDLEDRVVRQKFSSVHANDWCLPCYWNRHKAINRADPDRILRGPEHDGGLCCNRKRDDNGAWLCDCECDDCGRGWHPEPEPVIDPIYWSSAVDTSGLRRVSDEGVE